MSGPKITISTQSRAEAFAAARAVINAINASRAGGQAAARTAS